ncbi:hypothetical protein JX265_005992 [Neoarthrinium moseri]|uniref:Uncharacterized protein n=1 Tax=Neoarthrinium moseri TaxID=1658444 RepID=A0A9P9WMS8_9PEZI|nr:hypothetical protein JX265_005992 [Neoarthrinium moseri]
MAKRSFAHWDVWETLQGEWQAQRRGDLVKRQEYRGDLKTDVYNTFGANEGAAKEDYLEWLQKRRSDAWEEWRRLKKRIRDGKLDCHQQGDPEALLIAKYERYFAETPEAGAFWTEINSHFPNHIPPWNSRSGKDSAECDIDQNCRTCLDCKQTLPSVGESFHRLPSGCGICSAPVDKALLRAKKNSKEKIYICQECKTNLCISCGGPEADMPCSTCDRATDLPPKKLCPSKFWCWGCHKDLTERRNKKYRKDPARSDFRCDNCTTLHCLRCGKIHREDEGSTWTDQLQKYWYAVEDFIWPLPPRSIPWYARRAVRLGVKPLTMHDVYNPDNWYYEGDSEDDSDTSKRKARHGKIEKTIGPGSSGSAGSRTSSRSSQRLKIGPSQLNRISIDTSAYANMTDIDMATYNRQVYELAVKWAEKYFAMHGLRTRIEDEAWLQDLSPQFVQYANLVVHEDHQFGGYSQILNDKRNRKWLVVGILAQIIEKKIYTELLFGMTDEQRRLLDEQDAQLLGADGYARTKARSEYINAMLEKTPRNPEALPGRFWSAIDALAMSSAHIFMPLFNLTQQHTMDPALGECNPIDMVGELRKILAHAGFYHVFMRRSPTIYHILSATPGARMDYPIEGQADYELYRESKEKAEIDGKVWEAQEKARIDDAEHDPSYSKEDIAELKKEFRIASHYRLRGAKVKFAVWPMVTRYVPVNVGKPVVRDNSFIADRGRHRRNRVTQEEIEKGEGQRIVEIGKCVVVYYQGIIYQDPNAIREARDTIGLPLLAFVSRLKHHNLKRISDSWSWFWISLLSAMAATVVFGIGFWLTPDNNIHLPHLPDLSKLFHYTKNYLEDIERRTWLAFLAMALPASTWKFPGFRRLAVWGLVGLWSLSFLSSVAVPYAVTLIQPYIEPYGYWTINAFLNAMSWLHESPRLIGL